MVKAARQRSPKEQDNSLLGNTIKGTGEILFPFFFAIDGHIHQNIFQQIP